MEGHFCSYLENSDFVQSFVRRPGLLFKLAPGIAGRLIWIVDDVAARHC